MGRERTRRSKSRRQRSGTRRSRSRKGRRCQGRREGSGRKRWGQGYRGGSKAGLGIGFGGGVGQSGGVVEMRWDGMGDVPRRHRQATCLRTSLHHQHRSRTFFFVYI